MIISRLGCGIFHAYLWLLGFRSIDLSQHCARLCRTARGLVLGNSNYENVVRLVNPANDAAMVATMFRSAGFDVVDSRSNLKAADMRKALRDFGNKSRDADIAVIYYAGHGIEMESTNYLIPVDAQLESDTDVYDEAIALDRILVAVEPAKRLRLVILDACRDNPFSKAMKRTAASRSLGRGLAKVEPTSPNTMIAFAAKAGFTALDGDGKNSPFAEALVKNLPVPGLDLRKAFGFVRDEVMRATANKQEPYIYGSLGGEDVALVPAKPSLPLSAPVQQADARDYELALQLGSKAAWSSFLAKYPSGFYTDLAKGQLERITQQSGLLQQANGVHVTEAPNTQLTALTPTTQPSVSSSPGAEVSVRSIKKELQRLGCYAGAIDDKWSTAQAPLARFVTFAKIQTKIDAPSIDLLDAIRTRRERVCPLDCSARERERDGQCVAKSCPTGATLGDDGSCRVRRTKHESRRTNPSRTSASSEDAAAESMKIMGPQTLQTGKTVTLTSRSGRKMTCTGGDAARQVKRTCSWD